jgi:hypothetical protein
LDRDTERGGISMNETDDVRLRQLLVVEQRLQDLVRTAKENAARRIAEARAVSEHRLAASRDEAARADAQRARTERVVHEEALSAIHAAHQASLAAITSLSDNRVDELARWVIARAIAPIGEPS